MRSTLFVALLGSSVLGAVSAAAQGTGGGPQAASTPANLCQELLAYAEKKAAEPPKEGAGGGEQKTTAAAPPSRGDTQQSGTQGGGSVGPSSSKDTGTQASAPPTTPVSPGAQSAPASSPYASDSGGSGKGASPPGATANPAEFKLAGGVTLQQVRDTAGRGDRGACRDTTQELRRAGADLPAALIALAAYDPDAAKRQP
jgi:hypothetical protein